jgi:general secretion pathway protein I
LRAAAPARRGRGFTLIEVLVALLIVALGMGAVLAALTAAADNTMRLREKTFAEWVGFNQLASARLTSAALASGSKEGDVDFAGTRWHWQQSVTEMDVPGLKRITIQVRHADEPGAPQSAPKDTAAGHDWLATVMGFRGDALSSPLDVLTGWDSAGASPPGKTPGG